MREGRLYTLACDAYLLHPTLTAHLSHPKHAWLSHLRTAMQDRAIKLWNPHKGNLIKTYNGVLQHPQAFLPPQLMYIVSCAASRDGCAMQGMAMMSEMLWCPATTASTPALPCLFHSLLFKPLTSCTGIAGLASSVWAWLAICAQVMQSIASLRCSYCCSSAELLK